METYKSLFLRNSVPKYPLHDIKERSKFAAVLVIAVHAVGDSDKVNVVLAEHDFRVEAGLQIISADPAHVIYQHMGNLPGFDIRNQLFPCGTVAMKVIRTK